MGDFNLPSRGRLRDNRLRGFGFFGAAGVVVGDAGDGLVGGATFGVFAIEIGVAVLLLVERIC